MHAMKRIIAWVWLWICCTPILAFMIGPPFTWKTLGVAAFLIVFFGTIYLALMVIFEEKK